LKRTTTTEGASHCQLVDYREVYTVTTPMLVKVVRSGKLGEGGGDDLRGVTDVLL
jgi:hypothetical protein